MRRARRRALGGLGLGLLAVFALRGDAPAQDPPELRFERTELEIGGRITEVLPHDLNGDGRRDLFVVRGREALIYLQAPDGSWRSEAHQRFRFHPRTVLFDVGDLDGDGTAEVTLLQKAGVYAYRLRERGGRLLYGLRPERVLATPSFFSRPVKKEVRRKQLLRDLDGDGDLDLVLPRQDGFALARNAGEGRFEDPVLLSAPPEAVLYPGRDRLSSQLYAAYWFANPNVAQFDAAGDPEVVLAREGVVHSYGSAEPGALPLQLRGTYTIPDQRQFSRMVENPLELDFTMPLAVLDIDGDGRVDVSSTHVGKGTTRVFMNSAEPAKAFATPAQSIRAKGVTFLSYYIDIDGDGRLDLVIPRIDKISIWGILKVLVTRSVPVEALFFFQRSDGTFADEPDQTRDIEIPLAINSKGDRMRFGTSVVGTLEGDYDGDGLKDLLYRSDDDTLALFRGLPERAFAEEPTLRLEIEGLDAQRFTTPIVRDLDGDGRDDLVLRYWSWDRDDDRIAILSARAGP